LVVIQIFQQGQTIEDKQEMFAALATHLSTVCGLAKTDLVISCVENKPEDWSFGYGEAQFLIGKL
jgi:phenylpyruvate tautomerase PptA (4-oxalocrotonate tautomerase family)